MDFPDQSHRSGDAERLATGMTPGRDDVDENPDMGVGMGFEDGLRPGGVDNGFSTEARSEEFASFDPDEEWATGSTTDEEKPSSAVEGVKQAAAVAGDRVNRVAGSAQDEAAAVKDTAMAAGSDLADSVSEQAGEVAHEVGHQSRRLMDEGVSELRSQAGAGQQRLAELSRSFGGELQSMTRSTDASGPMTDLAHSAQQLFDDAANWLERNEPADVLDSVRHYASRNPWKFLAISAGVGFVGARIVRGLQKPDDGGQATPALHAPTAYRGNQSAAYSPMGNTVHAGGPRPDTEGRVQPSATPGTDFLPAGGPGIGSGQDVSPLSDPYGGSRGL